MQRKINSLKPLWNISQKNEKISRKAIDKMVDVWYNSIRKKEKERLKNEQAENDFKRKN